MRKSEMINRIEVLLESIGYVGPSNSGEKVLELIENEGMLPPFQGQEWNDRTETSYDLYEWDFEEI